MIGEFLYLSGKPRTQWRSLLFETFPAVLIQLGPPPLPFDDTRIYSWREERRKELDAVVDDDIAMAAAKHTTIKAPMTITFDEIHESPFQGWGVSFRRSQLFRYKLYQNIIKRLNANGTVLEIGCSTGFFTAKYLYPLSKKRLVACDISDAANQHGGVGLVEFHGVALVVRWFAQKRRGL